MTRHLLLLPAALLCLAAAPAPKPAPAKAPAAKAAPARPAATYDAQNPQSLMEILGAAGAKVQTSRREEDAVFVTVTSTAANFSLQFAGCNPQGRACQAALFDSVLDGASPTLSQINGFNQTSVFCRVYQDKTGRPHAIYAALLVKSDTRESAMTHLGAWQGCLGEARDFQRDPVAYLANAA
ncbi:MAG: YbjN domain-containing protein [Alphaproteobacteria bacterium]|nr:YbjN domain-containing protein [Alphaproteobacteria bacterium]MBU1515331.1 YbjN domain-containing protein [Alphaproteobacteria bacterium]MBU2095381.1 YbjN domain-containing protein [Alphaproteobacteria bacterium]MBU2152599.1 YbjN domain-containing protein [Alphaproteobacteria bacterium]MBU2309995.1 YbjN domain-containing protein [Alphaproteobacteria bacterium]